jgi:hypothetical protein
MTMSQNPEIPQPENKSTKLPFIILALLGLGLIGYCIFGAFALLNPKQSAAETETTTEVNNKNSEDGLQNPSEDAQALIDESAQWATVFEETFDSNTNVNGWNMGEATTGEIESDLEIKDGKYVWDVTSKNKVTGILSPMTLSTVSDFRLSADVKLTSGTYKPVYGVVFRDNPNGDGYFFGIYGETFLIDKYHSGSTTRFAESQKTPAIRPQETNRLTVIAKDSFLVFLINDQFVFEVVDEGIDQGTLGFGVTFFHVDLQNSFEFDNFIVKIP